MPLVDMTNVPHVFTHDGPGFCFARDVMERGDFCNEPVLPGHTYCKHHECDVPGCKQKWTSWWLLAEPQFKCCSTHKFKAHERGLY